jgi:hypothetical protein
MAMKKSKNNISEECVLSIAENGEVVYPEKRVYDYDKPSKPYEIDHINFDLSSPYNSTKEKANKYLRVIEDLENNKDMLKGMGLMFKLIDADKHAGFNPELDPDKSVANVELWDEVKELLRLMNIFNYAIHYDEDCNASDSHFGFELMLHQYKYHLELPENKAEAQKRYETRLEAYNNYKTKKKNGARNDN